MRVLFSRLYVLGCRQVSIVDNNESWDGIGVRFC